VLLSLPALRKKRAEVFSDEPPQPAVSALKK
jgi:hypothetical protein